MSRKCGLNLSIFFLGKPNKSFDKKFDNSLAHKFLYKTIYTNACFNVSFWNVLTNKILCLTVSAITRNGRLQEHPLMQCWQVYGFWQSLSMSGLLLPLQIQLCFVQIIPRNHAKLWTKKSESKTGLENQAVGRVSNPHRWQYPSRSFQKLLVCYYSTL